MRVLKKSIKIKNQDSLFLLILFLIISLGIFLRVWGLSDVPVSLFGDEVDMGYQSYSILKTGKDYLGNPFPVMFQSFSEYRLPMQIYSAVIPIAVFGLNEIGVRLASVFFGVLSIVGIYLLAKELFSRKIALIAAFFLAIAPWHLSFSRQANDAGFILPFIIFGTWFFLKGINDYKMLLLSAVSFSLTFYAYATASVFTPLYVVALLIIFRKNIFRYGFPKLFLVLTVSILILFPYIKVTFSQLTTQRFSLISVAADKSILEEQYSKRKLSNSFLSKLIYNKNSIILERISTNYLRSFSTRFLFTEGDPILRHSIGGFGELYRFESILIIVGLAVFLKGFVATPKKINSTHFLLLAWILIAPIPSSLTSDGANHAARLLLMLPALVLFSAIGFNTFITAFKKTPDFQSGDELNADMSSSFGGSPAFRSGEDVISKSNSFYKKMIFVFFIVLMVVDITKYFHKYYVIWPKESWRFWHSGYKEVMTFADSVDEKFSRIYFNNTYEPALVRFLFWYEYDPKLFQLQFKGDKHQKNLVEGFNGFRLGEKYYFGEIRKPYQKLLAKDILLVASARDDITNPGTLKESGVNLLKTIYSPTGDPIFYVITASQGQ